MVLLPKALLRLRGDKPMPGEPADENELKDMIDAPVGDRSRWQPRWPDMRGVLSYRSASLPWCARATTATVISYGRTLPLCVQAADQLQRERGPDLRRARSAQHLSLRLEGDQPQRAEDGPAC